MVDELQLKTYVEKVATRMQVAPSLLNGEMESIRGSICVVDSLTVKGHPKATNETNLQKVKFDGDEYLVFDSLTRNHTFLEHSTVTGDPIRLIDKTHPHGLLEVMIMQASRDIKPSICDLEVDTQKTVFSWMREFVDYAKEQELYPYMAYSYDPKTNDRDTGQGVKRFHVHLIGRTPEEINVITSSAKPLSTIDSLRARRLIDETSIVASNVLCDRLQQSELKLVNAIRPISDPANPHPTSLFQLRDGWDTLKSNDFLADFNLIHSNLLDAYREITSCLWEGQPKHWYRPTLRSQVEIASRLSSLSYLGDNTIEQILYAVQKSQPHLLRKTALLQREEMRDITTHVYPMAGACYSTSFCEIDGQPYCTIRPYLFSDLGGAGIGNPLGMITKVKKGVGVMNDEDMAKRESFQRGFVRKIQAL